MKMLLRLISLLLLVHTVTSQGLYDMFGFGTGMGGMADMFGFSGGVGPPSQGYDPFMTGGAGYGGGLQMLTTTADPAAAEARLTMAEEQMAEVMGESAQNSPERQRINRLINATGGRFSGDAAPLNYLVQDYKMTTPGTVPPPTPKQAVKGKIQGAGIKRQGGRRNRHGKKHNQQGVRSNRQETRGNGQGGAGMQQSNPNPTVPIGKIGYPAQFGRLQRPTQHAPIRQGKVKQRTGRQMAQQQRQGQGQFRQGQQQTNQMNGQMYQAKPPSNQMQGRKYQAKPPTNPMQGQTYQEQPPTNQMQGQKYQQEPPRNQMQGQSPVINQGVQVPQSIPIPVKTVTKQGGGPIAVDRLKRIQGRIDSITHKLSLAKQNNNMAQVQDLQGQLDALMGVKMILTGGSARSNKMETIKGTTPPPQAPKQTKIPYGPPPQAPKQTKIPYGPPQSKQNNNFQETNVGGKLTQTWTNTAPGSGKSVATNSQVGAPSGNSRSQNHQKRPATINVQSYQDMATIVNPYVPSYDQSMNQQDPPYNPQRNQQAAPYNQGMNQQGPPYNQQRNLQAASYNQGINHQAPAYDQGINQPTAPYTQGMNQQAPAYDQGMNQNIQGMNQQAPAYDQRMNHQGAPYNQGMNQQAPQYNQGMNQQALPYDQGLNPQGGAAGHAPAPSPRQGPTGTTVAPKLGDVRMIGNEKHIFYDADGFDTFQWVKESAIPPGQLDHLTPAPATEANKQQPPQEQAQQQQAAAA